MYFLNYMDCFKYAAILMPEHDVPSTLLLKGFDKENFANPVVLNRPRWFISTYL